jgi:thioredoxin-related protein
MNKFLMFTKDSCGPCGLVKRYIKALRDDRSSLIEEVELEDFSDVPIPQANLDIAKKYGITATPVLIVIDENGELLEKRTGGMPITQSIRKLWDQYASV